MGTNYNGFQMGKMVWAIGNGCPYASKVYVSCQIGFPCLANVLCKKKIPILLEVKFLYVFFYFLIKFK